jgi:hypothetical protein
MDIRGWVCYFTGPPGAAGVTTASNVTFKGSTVFKRNDWGAVFVTSPITVLFEGDVIVADNTKQLYEGGYQNTAPTADSAVVQWTPASAGGAGMYASGGAHLLANLTFS